MLSLENSSVVLHCRVSLSSKSGFPGVLELQTVCIITFPEKNSAISLDLLRSVQLSLGIPVDVTHSLYQSDFEPHYLIELE